MAGVGLVVLVLSAGRAPPPDMTAALDAVPKASSDPAEGAITYLFWTVIPRWLQGPHGKSRGSVKGKVRSRSMELR